MSLLLASVVLDALNRHVDGLGTTQLLTHPVATLVDAQRRAAGDRLVSLALPGWIVALLAQTAALVYLWRSGGAARWRDALRARLGSGAGARFAFGATLVLVARAAALVPSFYLWRIDRIMGLSTALTRVWAYEYAIETILGMIVAGCAAAIVLWLVERTHQWYLYTIAAVIAISLIGTLVDPYVTAQLFKRYAPLGGTIGVEARAFAAREGYPQIPLLVEHRVDRIPIDAADTQGMGATQRVVLSDTILRASTQGEIEFYLAEQLSQLDAHDPLNLAIIDAAIVILGLAVAVVIADRIPFRRDDDPISRMTLVGALLALVYIPAIAIDHDVAASMQLRAAQAAVTMTGDRASAMRALVRAGDDRVQQVCPGTTARVLLYRTPSLGEEASAVGGMSSCR